MNWKLGLDIGGTSFKAMAYVVDTQEFSPLIQRETGSLQPQDVLKSITEVYREFEKQYQTPAQSMGGGFPGILNPESRIIGSPNLPQWEGISLSEWSHQELGIPSCWTNDANCAALAEVVQPGRETIQNLVMITLGTGVGAGIVLNRQVFAGSGFAGEAGHIMVEEDGELCGCGRRGCLETVFSKVGFERAIAKVFPKERSMDLPELFAIAQDTQHADFPKVQAIMDHAFDAFAIGISNIITLLDPELIVLAGGLTQSKEYILGTLPQALAKRVMYPGYTFAPIEVSDLGSLAGVQGAIALAP